MLESSVDEISKIGELDQADPSTLELFADVFAKFQPASGDGDVNAVSQKSTLKMITGRILKLQVCFWGVILTDRCQA